MPGTQKRAASKGEESGLGRSQQPLVAANDGSQAFRLNLHGFGSRKMQFGVRSQRASAQITQVQMVMVIAIRIVGFVVAIVRRRVNQLMMVVMGCHRQLITAGIQLDDLFCVVRMVVGHRLRHTRPHAAPDHGEKQGQEQRILPAAAMGHGYKRRTR